MNLAVESFNWEVIGKTPLMAKILTPKLNYLAKPSYPIR